MGSLVALSIRAEDYDGPTSWRLAQWCLKHGANEWTVCMIGMDGAGTSLHDQFEELTQPYCIPAAERDNMSAYSGSQLARQTELWRLNSASLTLLQQFLPEGLFTYPTYEHQWLEDVTFYRQGGLMLGVVSHEREGIVRVTVRERSLLEDEGFAFIARGNYVGY